jgi:hypothetical protein
LKTVRHGVLSICENYKHLFLVYGLEITLHLLIVGIVTGIGDYKEKKCGLMETGGARRSGTQTQRKFIIEITHAKLAPNLLCLSVSVSCCKYQLSFSLG